MRRIGQRITPNSITIMRIMLIPVVLAFMLTRIEYGTIIAFVVFAIAAASDGVDGYLARSRNQVTSLGKLLDPLADKMLITSVLVALVQLEKLPAWVVVLIIAREFAVTGLRGIAAERGVVMAAGWLGKVKTTFQIALVLVLIPDTSAAQDMIVLPVMWLAIVFTVASAVHYFWQGRDLLRERDPG